MTFQSCFKQIPGNHRIRKSSMRMSRQLACPIYITFELPLSFSCVCLKTGFNLFKDRMFDMSRRKNIKRPYNKIRKSSERNFMKSWRNICKSKFKFWQMFGGIVECKLDKRQILGNIYCNLFGNQSLLYLSDCGWIFCYM